MSKAKSELCPKQSQIYVQTIAQSQNNVQNVLGVNMHIFITFKAKKLRILTVLNFLLLF